MNFLLLAQAADSTAPAVDPETTLSSADQIRRSMLEHVHKLQFTAMTKEEWISAAEYYGLRAAFVLVLMILAWTVSGWASSMVGRGMRRVKFDETLTKFLSKLVRWGILLMAALSCLSYFGVQTTSFAAVIGAAGLAVGLAFQGTLSNFAAGAMLLIFRPYKVGDVVNIAGSLGKVYEIELFTTSIDTFDNRRFIIPNSGIFGAVIENITYHPKRRADVAVGTDYSADLDETREILEAAVRSVPEVLSDPEPDVVLQELGGSSINWTVRGWATNDDFLAAKQGIIRSVKKSLDGAGIGIPFPQMDVHLETQAQ
ncbi:MAG: mechanosensitive ion channel [Lacipirellulaceae bacterium]